MHVNTIVLMIIDDDIVKTETIIHLYAMFSTLAHIMVYARLAKILFKTFDALGEDKRREIE